MAPSTSLLVLVAGALLCAPPFGHAFQSHASRSQVLPVRADPIPQEEIRRRLGLKEADGRGALSIGSGPHMAYNLANEHEVLCPVSGAHQGVLCTAALAPGSAPVADGGNSEAVANHHELVSQAILAGSLAVSLRDRCRDGSSLYYLPSVITLVESLMADEIASLDWEWGRTAFNSDGPETNEVLIDMGQDAGAHPGGGGGLTGERVTLFACHTASDRRGAAADVYVLPRERTGRVWRFSVEFKVATINLRQIPSFGGRDSTTPLRPDVWLKDDAY